MWLLIVPLIIVLVVVLGVGTLTTALFGALGSNWPWLLIAAGVWMFWHGDGRHRNRRRRRGWATSTVVTQAGPSAKPSAKTEQKKVEQKPTPITPIRKPELPIDMQVKVEQIRRKVDVLLGFADRFPPFSKDLYIVQQTASEYLPRTIDTYLAMPPEATDKPIGTTGKTPHQELKAQLELLDAKLDDIAQDLERQDMDRMLANRRFLEDRFGKHEPVTKATA